MSASSKKTGLDVVVRVDVTFVLIGALAFAVHRGVRADAGYELVVLFFGLLASGLALLVAAIIQFYRKQPDGAVISLVFMLVGFYLAWPVVSRLAIAY